MKEYALQLYSARNYPPLNEVLDSLASLGYTAVEGYGGLYKELDKLTAALAGSGLKMPSAHFDLHALETDPDGCLHIIAKLGVTSVYCPYLPPDLRPSDARGWRMFGAKLQNIAQPFLNAGLAFGWHNHDYEFEPLEDGARPIDLIFEGGPDIEWEADLAWIVRAGHDPIPYIEKYADRITAVHIKDLAPEGENLSEDGWADVGFGTINWAKLMKALTVTKVRHFVIEHDNPGDFKRFARRSIAIANLY